MKTLCNHRFKKKKYKLNLTDLMVLTYLFNRPMFGSLLLGQMAEEQGGSKWISASQGMRSLRKLCALNLVKGFPEPVPRGPLFGAFYSIKGGGRESLLTALAGEYWLRREPDLSELWTLMTAKVGLHNFRKIARRAGPKTKSVWRKIGFNYPRNGGDLFLDPTTFAKI